MKIRQSFFQDTYKIVLQWMFASGSLLWQIGDILIRPSWTAKSFRFQNFIDLFEKQPQKVDFSLRKITTGCLTEEGRSFSFYLNRTNLTCFFL